MVLYDTNQFYKDIMLLYHRLLSLVVENKLISDFIADVLIFVQENLYFSV